MSEEKIVVKVWENKGNKQLLITIPKSSNIKVGDHVEVKKLSFN